jgi:hypothetical protein
MIASPSSIFSAAYEPAQLSLRRARHAARLSPRPLLRRGPAPLQGRRAHELDQVHAQHVCDRRLHAPPVLSWRPCAGSGAADDDMCATYRDPRSAHSCACAYVVPAPWLATWRWPLAHLLTPSCRAICSDADAATAVNMRARSTISRLQCSSWLSRSSQYVLQRCASTHVQTTMAQYERIAIRYTLAQKSSHSHARAHYIHAHNGLATSLTTLILV